MTLRDLISYGYIAASVLFIVGLRMLTRAETARRGNAISSLGMLVAIVATLLVRGMAFQWILVGGIAGSLIGALAARMVGMTAMPEMVGLLNGCGGLASLLVGWAEFHRWAVHGAAPAHERLSAIAIFLTVLIGGVTFSGSMVAYGKLSEKLPGRPTLFRGQRPLTAAVLLLLVAAGFVFSVWPTLHYMLPVGVMAAALLLGALGVLPIGGADMPVVIALLNSCSGLAACAAGFVILNNVLIVAGSLVGASGLILTSIMCKAMNRSLANVLFAGVGARVAAGAAAQGDVRPISPEDAALILEAASSVVLVPGYGMAVAQAQHVLEELSQLLEANGTEVKFAIHPVAGRMPGHMNVLLAEANIPYELLVEPDDVNPGMSAVDVTLVIGANDVVNPAARTDENSPLYGMPILDVDKARTCIVLKRSLSPGFAGVDNPLFFGANTRMLFGDAKASLAGIVAGLKKQ